jgi:hypothetical protein
MLNYGMSKCQECSDKVLQALLANVFDALRHQWELLISNGIMDIEMDVDEFYNGGHGIYISFMDKRYYLYIQKSEEQ